MVKLADYWKVQIVKMLTIVRLGSFVALCNALQPIINVVPVKESPVKSRQADNENLEEFRDCTGSSDEGFFDTVQPSPVSVTKLKGEQQESGRKN